MLLLDIRKAFDRVHRGAIWDSLLAKRTPRYLVSAIMRTYDGSTAQFITHHGLSQGAQLARGVRQGCPMSPLLFAAAIDPILHELAAQEDGVQVHGLHVNHLAYADDLALVTNSHASAERLLGLVASRLPGIGLELSASKCDYLSPAQLPLSIGGHKLWPADGARRYLGLWITLDLNWEEGIAILWDKICCKLYAMLAKGTNTEDMVVALNRSVLPSLWYSLPSMTPTDKQLDCLERLISTAARKDTSPHMLEMLLYLNHSREPGWGLAWLPERLVTERGRQLLSLLECGQRLTLAGQPSPLHTIISREVVWRTNTLHTASQSNDVGLFSCLQALETRGWTLTHTLHGEACEIRSDRGKPPLKALAQPRPNPQPCGLTAGKDGAGLCPIPCPTRGPSQGLVPVDLPAARTPRSPASQTGVPRPPRSPRART